MSHQRLRGPDPVPVSEREHLTTQLWRRAGNPAPATRDARALSFPDGEGWGDLSWSELGERVHRVAAGLIASGVEPGARVAIMSTTRVEWTIADLAVLSVGAVTVPLYDTSSVEQCRWILTDSGATLALTGDRAGAERIAQAGRRGAPVEEVLVFDEGALDALAGRAGPAEAAAVDRRRSHISGADLATIVYTSGTTGPPKGCMLTHGGVVWSVRQAQQALPQLFGSEESTLLFLPLAHVFARFVQFATLDAGLRLGFGRSLDHLAEDLRTFGPTFLVVVPRVLEKVLDGARRETSGTRRRVFDLAAATAIVSSRRGPDGALWRPSAPARAVFDRLVYRRLRAALGGRLHTCISGGSALRPQIAHFFHGAGIGVLEGYGLTETTGPVAVNTRHRGRIGTVGPPLPGVEVRLDEAGEVLVAGRNVFAGYHANEPATREVFEDGWFRTGDIGEIHDGLLGITDRRKDLIVTANGENVPPRLLEERLEEHPLVAQAMVVGDDRPFVAALVALDAAELASRGPELATTDAIRAEIERAVDRANQAVSRAQSIREFRILDRELSEEHGELTPTMKVRRQQVERHFADVLASIYGPASDQSR